MCVTILEKILSNVGEKVLKSFVTKQVEGTVTVLWKAIQQNFPKA